MDLPKLLIDSVSGAFIAGKSSVLALAALVMATGLRDSVYRDLNYTVIIFHTGQMLRHSLLLIASMEFYIMQYTLPFSFYS